MCPCLSKRHPKRTLQAVASIATRFRSSAIGLVAHGLDERSVRRLDERLGRGFDAVLRRAKRGTAPTLAAVESSPRSRELKRLSMTAASRLPPEPLNTNAQNMQRPECSMPLPRRNEDPGHSRRPERAA